MEAYAHFRLDRQAIPCSKATMLTYEYTLGAFLRWVLREHPEVRRFEDPGRHSRAAIPRGDGPEAWYARAHCDAGNAGRRRPLQVHVLPLGGRRRLTEDRQKPVSRSRDAC